MADPVGDPEFEVPNPDIHLKYGTCYVGRHKENTKLEVWVYKDKGGKIQYGQHNKAKFSAHVVTRNMGSLIYFRKDILDALGDNKNHSDFIRLEVDKYLEIRLHTITSDAGSVGGTKVPSYHEENISNEADLESDPDFVFTSSTIPDVTAGERRKSQRRIATNLPRAPDDSNAAGTPLFSSISPLLVESRLADIQAPPAKRPRLTLEDASVAPSRHLRFLSPTAHLIFEWNTLHIQPTNQDVIQSIQEAFVVEHGYRPTDSAIEYSWQIAHVKLMVEGKFIPCMETDMWKKELGKVERVSTSSANTNDLRN